MNSTMPTQQCSPDCPKMIKRRKLHEEKLARKNRFKSKQPETDDDIAPSTVTSRASQADLSIDSSGLSNETEYITAPFVESSSKDAKEHIRKYVDNLDKVKKSHKSHAQGPQKRPPTPRQKKIDLNDIDLLEIEEQIIRDDSSPQRVSHERTKFDYSKKKDQSCINEECSGKPKIRKRNKTSEMSLVDPTCPTLCDLDLLKIPESKQRCESSCPSQVLEDEEREMDQAEVDRYVLYGGLRYFDDLCHCSLKCLLVQIFGDKFVQKTASSAFFFAMAMKLCYELDSWFIPFK